jgi:hypothetical protein
VLNFPTNWFSADEQIGDPTAADGILDLLVPNAHRVEMTTEGFGAVAEACR